MLLSKQTKKLIQKLRLSKKDFDDIQAAVEAEEKNTSGEIAIALIRESDDYSFWELFFAVLCGAAVFVFLLPFASRIQSVFSPLVWVRAPWQLPAVLGFISFLTIALFFFFANIPAIDRRIVPFGVRHRAVYTRALRHFVESGVYATENHSGILIFISVMEREVRIIADIGIASKIEQEEWNGIAKKLSLSFKSNTVKDGLLTAIQDCGALLKTHFPATNTDTNELPDGLIVLEVDE